MKKTYLLSFLLSLFIILIQPTNKAYAQNAYLTIVDTPAISVFIDDEKEISCQNNLVIDQILNKHLYLTQNLDTSPTPTLSPSPTIIYKPVIKPRNKIIQTAVNSNINHISPFDPLFEKYASDNNLDQNFLRKIAKCESTFNPNAVNGIYQGLYQFSASTWKSTRKSMGLDENPELRNNPDEAIKTAAWKIAHGGIKAWPVCGRR